MGLLGILCLLTEYESSQVRPDQPILADHPRREPVDQALFIGSHEESKRLIEPMTSLCVVDNVVAIIVVQCQIVNI